jgi:hypothetical protein
MRRHMWCIFNPEGWQSVAGGRSAVETPGGKSAESVHPEGMPDFLCDPCGVGGRLGIGTGGVPTLDPRLLSGKPSDCGAGSPTPNNRSAGSWWMPLLGVFCRCTLAKSYGVERSAFTLLELLVIIPTVLGLVVLVYVLMPAAARRSRTEACRENQRQIGLAFKTWSLDAMAAFSTHTPLKSGGSADLIASGKVFVHFSILSNQLSTPKLLVCPADRAKKAASRFDSVFSDNNVSYFVGVDAEENNPGDFLSGDRNLAVGGVALRPGLFTLRTNAPLTWTDAIHHSCGNMALTDGSVQLFDLVKLAAAVRTQKSDTNRLAIP